MKLAILDKDGTLVKPKSGGTFVQHPEDQELLPGVEGAIAALIEDGYTLAIVSNQRGVMEQECKAQDFPVFAYLLNGYESAKRIIKKEVDEGIVALHSNSCMAPKSGWYKSDQIVRYQYKTLDNAIAEMRYCLSLLPQISAAYFCPDDGETCYHVIPTIRHEYVPGRPHEEITGVGKIHHSSMAARLKLNGTYRKPNAGMLKAAIGDFIVYQDALMIGDRPEDEGAAQSASMPFMWADEWRKPFV